MAIARIENGAVVEIRDMDMADVPTHKRALWLPVVVEGSGERKVMTVESGVAVRIVHSMPCPDAITPYQARRALTARGLRAAVEAAVASGNQDLKDAWEYATVVERRSPFVQQLSGALNLSDADVDAIFLEASQLS